MQLARDSKSRERQEQQITDMQESYQQRIKELEKEIAVAQQKFEFQQVTCLELQQSAQERSRAADSVLKAMEQKQEETNKAKEKLEH